MCKRENDKILLSSGFIYPVKFYMLVSSHLLCHAVDFQQAWQKLISQASINSLDGNLVEYFAERYSLQLQFILFHGFRC